MASQLANAHIEAERRLRALISGEVSKVWQSLPHYNTANVDEFLSRAVPVVNAGKRQSAAITEAYLARALGRQPIGIDIAQVTASIRSGATTEDVYKRPFVTVWDELGKGTPWADAVAMGLDRATSAAATDMQLAMRQTVQATGRADSRMQGYERVPDGNACEFCLLAAGQRYTTEDLLPMHSHCGCGVEPITADFEPSPQTIHGDQLTVTVADHGELGPVLVDANQHFTKL